MFLTNQQIFALAEAISFLDGQHITQIVEGKAVAIFRSFRLAHTARWALARAQGVLQTAIADFNRAKDALIKHHSDGESSITPASPKFDQFIEDLEKLRQIGIELDLDVIEKHSPYTGERLHLQMDSTPADVKAFAPARG